MWLPVLIQWCAVLAAVPQSQRLAVLIAAVGASLALTMMDALEDRDLAGILEVTFDPYYGKP